MLNWYPHIEILWNKRIMVKLVFFFQKVIDKIAIWVIAPID